MKNNDLYELFTEQLQDIVSVESQIVKSLPMLIEKASNEELKKTLKTHLEESKKQVGRLDRICSILGIKGQQKLSRSMESLLREGRELVEDRSQSPAADVAVIIAAQKVKHYEIATYGILRSFAKQLGLDDEIVDLFEESLKEEAVADKKLTKIAEGSFFTSGINKLATTASSKR